MCVSHQILCQLTNVLCYFFYNYHVSVLFSSIDHVYFYCLHFHNLVFILFLTVVGYIIKRKHYYSMTADSHSVDLRGIPAIEARALTYV